MTAVSTYQSPGPQERQRRQKAHIPSKVRFATQTGLAKGMLQSAINAGSQPAWFVADEVSSRDASCWRSLEPEVKQPYVLTVNKRQPTPIHFKTDYAEDLAHTVPPQGWQRLSTGAGTKGERYYEWAGVKLSCRQPEGFSRWFLLRHCPEHPGDPSLLSYYQVFAPSHTALETMVGVAGQRWRIQECFQFAKDQLGLGDYEVRSWTGWHRHLIRLSLAELRRWLWRFLFPRSWYARIYPTLVFLAPTSSSSRSLPSLP